ncbi:MAG TPA: GNAT family N-acetyltransferase [Burkholderiaceae bacterium]
MNYRTRIASSLADVGKEQWDGLLAGQARAAGQDEVNPFLRYDFLHAMHETGCADSDSGWQPQYLTVWDGAGKEAELVGAMPLYVKWHSYGEYVFDWAWADAYRRHGLEYYPKLLSSIPFTPVTGSRLIAKNTEAMVALVEMVEEVRASPTVSSMHVLYPPSEQAEMLHAAGFMLRSGVQFHWENQDYANFDEFLGSLEQKKRKNIRAERRKVMEAGVTFRQLRGEQIKHEHWQFFTRCYDRTYAMHGSQPYLNLEFFERVGAAMPEHTLLVLAERAGRPIASSLVFHTDTTLYGRYWGGLEDIPCLHFETAYYQPLEFCIAEGLKHFEGGAQGEHKMARGFLPQKTWSAHWLAHAGFADAIEQFLTREAGGINAYVDELNERNPFKP